MKLGIGLPRMMPLGLDRGLLLEWARNPDMPFDKLVHRGSTDALAAVARRYADAGVDSLILTPQVPSLDQVDAIARDVLPAYAS